MKIKMFGGFEVSHGSNVVFTKSTYCGKAVQIFQYLLLRRGQDVLRGELAAAILGDDEYDNSASVIKNLVFRLRKMFTNAGVDEQIIIYKNGFYGLTDEIDFDIDTERFSDYYKQLHALDVDIVEQLGISLNALKLYHGDLLKDVVTEAWVIQEIAHFQNMYREFLETACQAAKITGNCDTLIDFLEQATNTMPYDEGVAAEYISCLAECREIRKAQDFYEKVTDRLMDDLGIKPSDVLTDAYLNSITGLYEKPDSVTDIQSRISEEMPEGGTFYCTVEVFLRIYWYVFRQMERTGQSIYMMLCTMSESDGSFPEAGAQLKKVTENFHKAINQTLRGSDVYTRYGPAQFLALLPEINRENCDTVTKRLCDNFKKRSRTSNIKLTCRYTSVAEIDRIFGDSSKE